MLLIWCPLNSSSWGDLAKSGTWCIFCHVGGGRGHQCCHCWQGPLAQTGAKGLREVRGQKPDTKCLVSMPEARVQAGTGQKGRPGGQWQRCQRWCQPWSAAALQDSSWGWPWSGACQRQCRWETWTHARDRGGGNYCCGAMGWTWEQWCGLHSVQV